LKEVNNYSCAQYQTSLLKLKGALEANEMLDLHYREWRRQNIELEFCDKGYGGKAWYLTAKWKIETEGKSR